MIDISYGADNYPWNFCNFGIKFSNVNIVKYCFNTL
jgi:hypothetical protein